MRSVMRHNWSNGMHFLGKLLKYCVPICVALIPLLHRITGQFLEGRTSCSNFPYCPLGHLFDDLIWGEILPPFQGRVSINDKGPDVLKHLEGGILEHSIDLCRCKLIFGFSLNSYAA